MMNRSNEELRNQIVSALRKLGYASDARHLIDIVMATGSTREQLVLDTIWQLIDRRQIELTRDGRLRLVADDEAMNVA